MADNKPKKRVFRTKNSLTPDEKALFDEYVIHNTLLNRLHLLTGISKSALRTWKQKELNGEQVNAPGAKKAKPMEAVVVQPNRPPKAIKVPAMRVTKGSLDVSDMYQVSSSHPNLPCTFNFYFKVNVSGKLDACPTIEVLGSSLLENNTGVSRGDKKHCIRGNQAIRKTGFNKLGNILILHVSRFAYNSKGLKLKNSLKFENILHLDQLMNNSESATFKLSAVVCHEGSNMDSGHYYTYAEHNGLWLNCNDTVVNVIDGIYKVLQLQETTNVYLLIYTRGNFNV